MAAQIKVTACDNELIIIAFQWGVSYELCRILSGNQQGVAVTLNIHNDVYQGGVTLNGVNSPLNDTIDITCPAGEYHLQVCGINWGGVSAFAGTATDLNGASYPFNEKPANPPVGVVYSQVFASFKI